MKKIIATVLAMVMALALCTTAFSRRLPTTGYLKGYREGRRCEQGYSGVYPNTDPKTTDGKTTAGVYAHYTVKYENGTEVGKFIVVSSLAEATAVLYNEVDAKNVVLYLAKIPTADYVAGKVYNDFADMCGKYDKPANYDATKTYYTYEYAGNTYLAVADSTTGDGVLVVDGKVVVVSTLRGVSKVGHVAVPTSRTARLLATPAPSASWPLLRLPNYASIPADGTALGIGNWY